jgi:hypothetical protein
MNIDQGARELIAQLQESLKPGAAVLSSERIHVPLGTPSTGSSTV